MKLDFAKGNGLIPAIVQDADSQEVLMLAYINEEALSKTLETGRMHYYSRSRDKLWLKGETSGHFQEVRQILVDCDEDAIVVKVHQLGGAACHIGYNSCFFREHTDGDEGRIIKDGKVFDPAEVYGE